MTRDPLATVAVVQRDRFSPTRAALERLYEVTDPPFRLIYVDGGSPPRVRAYLTDQARRRGFHLLRRDSYLSPNEARNLALRHVNTRYVVFLDNDVLVTPGWLEALVGCAKETGAWTVGPIYCLGPPEAQRIHMFGGDCYVREVNGRMRFVEKHHHAEVALAEVRKSLHREPTELVEFHCMLVRREAFEQVGFLDELLLSNREHPDLCLRVRQAGGTVFLEPSSLVTWMAPPPVQLQDLPFFLRRWSDEWNWCSLCHFRDKWGLTDDGARFAHSLEFLEGYRWAALGLNRPQALLRKLLGWRRGTWLTRRLFLPPERALTRLLAPETRRLPYRLGDGSPAVSPATPSS